MILIGYAVVDGEGVVTERGGALPSALRLPNGTVVQPGTLGTYGAYRAVERWDDETPAPSRWHVVSGESEAFDGTKVTVTKQYALPSLADRKAAMSRAIDTVWEGKTFVGFSYDFGGEVGAKVMQTRAEDQTRWLAVKDLCNEALAANIGGQNYPIPLRPLDNLNITVTYQQACDMLRAMRTQQAGLLAYSWGLKDAVTAAADNATLDGIDIDTGWPG